jgi:hypothetical protein
MFNLKTRLSKLETMSKPGGIEPFDGIWLVGVGPGGNKGPFVYLPIKKPSAQLDEAFQK